ncbi:FtsQ-type POTRA domain-containing protein [Soehngenia longivitae]|uniref:FtsQ-type POTRA domain-containing protein n=1 Tax=Soehngenia longivitae TaxID=2562294 RepID=A0A4Z0D4W4_9FIRM|nr:FtsQ-type POTRA domain-containing protein [Soehngenia longivitae]TFZ40096.1 FtsQ-type POTRA domain-containing protein [Soehngenia longivitae]
MNKLTRVERKRRRKRFFRRIFLLFIVIVIIYNAIIRIDLFNVGKIEISGNNITTEAQIIEKADIKKGDNLFRINRFTLADRLREIGYIEEIDIDKVFPSTIRIKIDERIPYVEVIFNEKYYVFDINGILLEKRTEPLGELTLISNLKIQDIKEGQKLDINSEFIDIFNDEKVIEVVSKIKSFDFTDENNIKIILDEDIPVEFGSLYNIKYKLLELGEIINDIEKKNIPTKMIIMNKGEYPILVRDDE